MEHKVEILSQIIVRPQQASKRKLEASDTFTRPLMLSTWSQTTGDGLEFQYDQKYKDEQTEREKALIERKLALEEQLKVHTDLLSEIHETSARTAQLLAEPISLPPLQSTKPIQIQLVESQSSTQAVYKTPQLSHKKYSSNNSPTSSGMSPWHSLVSTTSERDNYNIIAEDSGEDYSEPMDRALNSSPDFGSIPMCLVTEENVEIKTEDVYIGNTASYTGHNFNKRRQLENFNYNNDGLLIITHENANRNNISPQYHPRNCRLLKTYKSESYSCSANIQTTPLQSLKPSPYNNLSSLSGNSEVGGNPMDWCSEADENNMINKRTPMRQVNKENITAGCSKNLKS